MIEHRTSGLLKTLGPAVAKWNRSIGELYVANGSRIVIDGANEGGERIQGEEFRGAWCDEIGLWKAGKKKRATGEKTGGVRTWEESLTFAVRMEPGLIFCTGTPKGNIGVVKILREEPEGEVDFSFPSLRDNEKNLLKSQVQRWRRKYAGTRLGRQELEGEVLEDVEGALWTLDLIEEGRLDLTIEECRSIIDNRCAVAVDPAITATDESDETGIIVAQTVPVGSDLFNRLLAEDPTLRDDAEHALILDDRSGTYTPRQWAQAAIQAYHDYRAEEIIAEANQGGEMVETVIRNEDPNIPVRLVWASEGKKPRAKPVSALYEQGRVHHVMREGHDGFEFLESEQTSWVEGSPSPNHLDALVWAITGLILEQTTEWSDGSEVGDGETYQPAESTTGDLIDRVM
jgi:phage terminase large subunit-like protein